MIDIITFGELEALYLCGPYSTESPHQAGNRIIALAERIKAQRAVAAMPFETMRLKGEYHGQDKN